MNIQQYGKTEELNIDNGIFKYELGAITCFDSKNMSDDTTVDVTILANNIQKIYKTTKALANRFEIADYISPEEKLEKEISAFANADGGTIYIGIDESKDKVASQVIGVGCGIDKFDEIQLSIQSSPKYIRGYMEYPCNIFPFQTMIW